jgi:putative polyhydroxyalkanoate system protein
MLPQIGWVQKADHAPFCISPRAVKLVLMSEMSITRVHRLSTTMARLAAEQVATDLQHRFGLTCTWGDDGVLRFERPGVNGQLFLGGTEVTVEVRLSAFYLAFRDLLESKINTYFDRRFA